MTAGHDRSVYVSPPRLSTPFHRPGSAGPSRQAPRIHRFKARFTPLAGAGSRQPPPFSRRLLAGPDGLPPILSVPVDRGRPAFTGAMGQDAAGPTGPRPLVPEDGQERGRGLCHRSRSPFFDLSGGMPSGTPGKDIFRRVSPADSPCRGGSRRRAPGSPYRAPRRDEGGRRRKGPKGARPSPPRRGRRSGGHLRGSGGRGSR